MKNRTNPTDKEGNQQDKLDQKIDNVRKALPKKYKLEGCKIRVRLRHEGRKG